MTDLIKEIPLLFQTEMVQANMEDRKSQTRRINDLELVNKHPDQYKLHGITDEVDYTAYPELDRGTYALFEETNPDVTAWVAPIKCPYGKKGDLLWVRENWQWEGETKWSDAVAFGDFWYKADNYPLGPSKWKPSIHMPKTACRLWLMVEEIRCERVQDISEDDARAEGVELLDIYDFSIYRDYSGNHDGYHRPEFSFESLWISINGKESWKQNPWVWVVKYRILSRTGRPSEEIIRENWEALA